LVTSVYTKHEKTDVAVVGLSCVFPGAQDAQTFWQNIVNKVDSTQSAPADRIDPVHFSDATNPVDRFIVNGRVYS
jgi:acyl transferase domain-containing protein